MGSHWLGRGGHSVLSPNPASHTSQKREGPGQVGSFLFFKKILEAQMVKNLRVMWETWVPSLGRGGPLEEGMATCSSICARKIPWIEESGELQF